ncbi:MAG: hypothetical protein Q9227_000716 [Pyrenula ochraceoflavens]
MPEENALSPTIPDTYVAEDDEAGEGSFLLPHPDDNGQTPSIVQNEPRTSSYRDRPLPPTPPPPPPKRQSSLSQPKTNGQPRTPNRVRFAELPSEIPTETIANGHPTEMFDIDEEDYLDDENGDAPLLPSNLSEPRGVLPLPGSTPKSSLLAAFTNMSNSIIGAGIIGLPYALRNAGFLTGIMLLIVLTVVVDWTIRLIPINSKMSGRDTFQGTMEYCYGRIGLFAVSAAQWAFAFGGMVAFGVIVGDTIPAVIRGAFPGISDKHFLWLLGDRTFIIIVVIGGVSWPLSLYRDIAKLAKASTLALISMLIIIITVITQGARVPKDLKGDFTGLWFINSGFFQSVGVISFVTHLSTFVSLLACLAMGLAGFLTFGSKTQGDVLNNFPMSSTSDANGAATAANPLVLIARLCFGLNMLTTLPLECFVCREVIVNYFVLAPELPTSPTTRTVLKPLPSLEVHFFVTTALVLSSMTISILTNDLGGVFELIGATSACMLAYILPPLCYVKLAKRKTRWQKVPCYICIAFGVAVMVVSVVLSVRKAIVGKPAEGEGS